MDKIRNLMLYGGLRKEEYNAVYESIWESNRKILVGYSLIVVVGMLILYVLSFFSGVLESSRTPYLMCIAIGCVMLFIALGPFKKNTGLIRVSVAVFTSFLLAFGILLGTIVEPKQASASYGILMFAVPLLFADSPLLTDIQILISIAVYLLAAKATQAPDMYSFNVSFVLPYGAACLILCAMIMRDKIVRHYLSYENKVLSEKDQLTGLYNRRCYEQKIQQLVGSQYVLGTLFCAFDINGLKVVNDTLGHKAGDELLIGAAECINGVFGRYGTCYRIGGDEFFAIIEGKSPDIAELEREVNDRCRNFHGALVSNLSISVGIVRFEAGDEVKNVVMAADKKMYAAKEAYYSRCPAEQAR